MKIGRIALVFLVVFILCISGSYALSTSTFGNVVVKGNTTFNGTYVNNTGNEFIYGNLTTKGAWHNHSGDLNLGGNLSLGDKITFRLGEMIDNIVNGWIRLTANTNVTGSLDTSGNATFRGEWINASNASLNIGGNLSLGDMIRFRLGEVIDNIIDELIRVQANLNVTKNAGFEHNATVADTLTAKDFKVTNLESNIDGTGYNITIHFVLADYVNATEIFAAMNWTFIQKFPAPCPAGAITGLNDSVTCSDFWVYNSGDEVTGDLNFTSLAGLRNMSFIVMNGNINMSENNITNVSHLWVTTIHGGSSVNFADSINLTYDGTERNITNSNYVKANYVEGDGRGLVNLTAYNGTYLERNATSDLNMTNHTIWDLEKLYFSFGEYIDNLKDGWIKITGSLFVTEELNVSGPATFNDNVNVTEKNITNVNSVVFSLGEYVDNLVDGWLKLWGNVFVTGELNVTGETTLNNDLNLTRNGIVSVGNLSYDAYVGQAWFHNDSSGVITTVINTQDVWENMTGFNGTDSGNILRGYSFDANSNYLIPLFDGLYEMEYSTSFISGANTHWQFSMAVNGVLQEDTDCHSKIGTGADIVNCKGGGYVPLSEGDLVQLQVVNRDNTNNLDTLHGRIGLERKGN